MSELIQKNDNRATIRWKLLTGASALAMTCYVSTADMARAGDTDRPVLWLEFGGQMDQVQGLSAPFTASFMSVTPTPAPYHDDVFDQSAPRIALGAEGKITFHPEDSDWSFSAGIRYGRSHSRKHVHHQTSKGPIVATFYNAFPYYTNIQRTKTFPTEPLVDTRAQIEERHSIVDFQVGKDVGLGLMGSGGTSSVSAGVRFAQFKAKSSVDIHARPDVNGDLVYFTLYYGYISFASLWPNFYQHELHGRASRSFDGVGPSLSWNGSAVLAGNTHDGELTLDFGVSGALLFGKQKVKVDHTTQTHHFYYTNSGGGFGGFHGRYPLVGYNSGHSDRSRSVIVPNVGGFAELSFRYIDAKVSVGYRMDSFLNAMDTGIDVAKKSNLSFNGPYASISIGLGD